MAEADTPFVWTAGGGQMSPSQVAAQRKVAEAMMVAGQDATPIRSWTQGAARVAQALVGSLRGGVADQQEAEGRKQAIADAVAKLQGFAAPAEPAAAPASPAASIAPGAASAPPARPMGSPMLPIGQDTPASFAERPKVASSPTVVGDDEAEAAGLYEPRPAAIKTVAAAAPPAPPVVAASPSVRTVTAAMSPQPAAVAARPDIAGVVSAMSNDWLPPAFAGALAAQIAPKAPLVVKQGDTVVDPRTYQPLYKSPKDESSDSTNIKDYKYYLANLPAGTTPIPFDTWSTARARATATNVNTNVDTRAETEQSKAIGKARGEVQAEDIKAGSHASNKLRQLATLDEANKSGGDDISSGPLGKAILTGKQGLSELTGVDLKGVPESEVIQKVGFGLATNMVKAITNRPSQMEFGKALENVPGLYMSKQGRVAMTSILTQDARAEQELGRLAYRHKETPDGLSWQEVKDRYYEEHPLMSPFTGKPFGQTDIQMLTKAGGGAAAGSGSTPAPTVINGYTIKELP